MFDLDEQRSHVKLGVGEMAGRRRREAGLLADARHPGVVEIDEVLDHSDRCELRLVRVSGHSLDQHPPFAGPELIRLLGSVARTVADLHRAGIRHGNLRSDHVLVDDRGRSVLCGFGDAGRDGEPEAPSEEADLAAFGRLALGEAHRSIDAGMGGTTQLQRITQLAERAARGGDGWSMHEVVDELGAIQRGETRGGVRLPAVGRTGALVGIAAMLAAALWLWWPRSDDPTTDQAAPTSAPLPSLAPSSTRAPATTSVTLAPHPQPTLVRSLEPQCTAVDVGVDLDGDGCREAAVVSGNLVSVGDAAWSIGAEGDVVVLGAWWCGDSTPALLTDDGDMFFFPRWPEPGSDLTVSVAHKIEPDTGPGGLGVEVVDVDGCARIEVATDQGSVLLGPVDGP